MPELSLPIPETTVGQTFRVSASFADKAKFFKIELLDFNTNEIYLNFLVKFKEKTVELNSALEGDAGWGKKESPSGFPFDDIKHFDIAIIVESTHFNILVNENSFCIFRHRAGFAKINTLKVVGDVTLCKIEVAGVTKALMGPSGTTLVPPAVTADQYPELTGRSKLLLSGSLLEVAVYQTGNQRHSQEPEPPEGHPTTPYQPSAEAYPAGPHQEPEGPPGATPGAEAYPQSYQQEPQSAYQQEPPGVYPQGPQRGPPAPEAYPPGPPGLRGPPEAYPPGAYQPNPGSYPPNPGSYPQGPQSYPQEEYHQDYQQERGYPPRLEPYPQEYQTPGQPGAPPPQHPPVDPTRRPSGTLVPVGSVVYLPDGTGPYTAGAAQTLVPGTQGTNPPRPQQPQPQPFIPGAAVGYHPGGSEAHIHGGHGQGAYLPPGPQPHSPEVPGGYEPKEPRVNYQGADRHAATAQGGPATVHHNPTHAAPTQPSHQGQDSKFKLPCCEVI